MTQTLTLEKYFRFWNTDAEELDGLDAEVFVEDVEYHAVVGLFTGAEQLSGLRSQFIEHLGGITFRARGSVDHHHDRARQPWEVFTPDGASFATGTDIMRVAPDGRIAEVTTFLDRAPEGFDEHHADDGGAEPDGETR